MFAVFVNLMVGLPITAAVGLLLVGAFNLISVYFAVLFVGIGVDFAIQYSVRYRAERHDIPDLYKAIRKARALCRRAADARGLRHRARLLLVPADRITRACRSSASSPASAC